MALPAVTLRPVHTSDSQQGAGTIAGGSANADAALADNSDLTYVQLAQRVRLDSDVVRVAFGTPSIPAGAKVYSVTVKDRVQTVQTTTTYPNPPVCHHWLRCKTGEIEVSGEQQKPNKEFFTSPCPTTTTTTTPWQDRTLKEFTSGPGGQPWDINTNLADLTYDIGRGDDYATNLRYAAVYLDITYQRLSTITVTGPASPSTATKPTITWTYASADSQPQQAYRVAIYTAAQVAAPGFSPFVTTPQQSSGWLLGEDLQWTLPNDIVDGTYSAYVQATSKWNGPGDFPTDIASRTWTRAVAPANPPPAPVLNSVIFDPSIGPGWVEVVMTPGGSSPTTTAFTVQRSIDNGVTWIPIPRLTRIAADGLNPVTGYDYTAPKNVLTKYRVIAYTGSPLVASATTSSELGVVPTGDRHAFIHPDDPLLNTTFMVKATKSGEGIKITRRQMQGVFQGVGGPGRKVLPIVLDGPWYGDEYEITARFVRRHWSEQTYDALTQIITKGSPLLFQRPDGTQLWVKVGPGVPGRDTEETYEPLAGNPRVVLKRDLKFTATEIAPPVFY